MITTVGTLPGRKFLVCIVLKHKTKVLEVVFQLMHYIRLPGYHAYTDYNVSLVLLFNFMTRP